MFQTVLLMPPLWPSLHEAGDVGPHFNTVILMQVARGVTLEQGLASALCEGPDGKYLRLCRPHCLSQVLSSAGVVRKPSRQYVNKLRLAVFQ